jgi:hypothetical protein
MNMEHAHLQGHARSATDSMAPMQHGRRPVRSPVITTCLAIRYRVPTRSVNTVPRPQRPHRPRPRRLLPHQPRPHRQEPTAVPSSIAAST